MGICLGFQSLCYEFGNDVSKLQKVKHGQVYDIYPVSKSELFPDDESPFGSVRYHSLYVENTNDEIIPWLIVMNHWKLIHKISRNRSRQIKF